MQIPYANRGFRVWGKKKMRRIVCLRECVCVCVCVCSDLLKESCVGPKCLPYLDQRMKE